MTAEQQLYSKAEVYRLIKLALAPLGRTDEPHNYGIARDRSSGRLIIYFDLPYVSPLQFNIEFDGRDIGREALLALIGQAIKRRLEIRSSTS